MLKKKSFVLCLISMFIVLSILSTTNAQTPQTNLVKKASIAIGAGTFIHEHDGIPHNHYFAFGVSDGHLKRDGWHYNPVGKFYMIVTHENEIHMIAKSYQIERFMVTKVEGGLNAVFEGFATVKHMDENWQKGWRFTVEAFDSRSKGEDFIHIAFTAPDGTQHHMEGELTSGNILIK